MSSGWPGIFKLFPARESFVSDISAGDGNIANLFYSVKYFVLEHALWTSEVGGRGQNGLPASSQAVPGQAELCTISPWSFVPGIDLQY